MMKFFSRGKASPDNQNIRAELFDSFSDGIIILDDTDVILDMNPAAEAFFGLPVSRARGNPVDMLLENWKSIAGVNEAKEVEFRGSIHLNKQWRFISVRTNKLEKGGRVIILRDITDRRDTHEVRQHAREEMFNLLRSIFKSTNTSQSSNDLFRDVLFQIAYTFRADSGVISLVETLEDSGKFKYTLMARQGMLVQDNEALVCLYSGLETSGWSENFHEPLVISDAARNMHFARLAKESDNICLVILPLLYYEQLMGVLILARGANAGFQSDEIVRLGVVTEELASFIYSDRKRKADIALSERHRLSQDLHDSITQKLVGLLQLTQAVKLGLESGASIDGKRIDRIIESARQALREMRLFLFELAPVDIERDGLLSILQSRLASVEGRSDIQARMLTDSDIVLTTLEETEIYYIVEEALNNILKHANAKSVTISLKQQEQGVFLEIIDNGSGFDLDQVKEGSRGLGNIRERARRLKANLNISSTPGQGTKITLVVPK
jgi:PAS domain S-box-containing protein